MESAEPVYPGNGWKYIIRMHSRKIPPPHWIVPNNDLFSLLESSCRCLTFLRGPKLGPIMVHNLWSSIATFHEFTRSVGPHRGRLPWDHHLLSDVPIRFVQKTSKCHKNHEYSRINEKNQIISAVLDVCFHKILGIEPKDTVSWNIWRCISLFGWPHLTFSKCQSIAIVPLPH